MNYRVLQNKLPTLVLGFLSCSKDPYSIDILILTILKT
jgi:hypothetical protein